VGVERVVRGLAQIGVVQLRLAIVVPEHEAAGTVPARAAGAQVGILDIHVRVALRVEPHDVPAVLADIEPTQQRLAQPRVGDRGAGVPQLAGAIEAQPDLAHLLEQRGREV
jgi:hypothetical protein